MNVPKVFDSEYKFCLIMWANEPISCSELSNLCKEKLGWAKTTTYTVVKRLCDRGIIRKDGPMVTSLYSKEQVMLSVVNELIEKTFEGSFDSFLDVISKRQQLSDEDAKKLKELLKK